MKLVVRSVLALSLLVSAYALVVGLVAALALLLRAVGGPGAGYGAFRLGILVVVLAAAAVWVMVSAALRTPDPIPGVRLSRASQPDLWSLMDRVALQVGTRGPDELVLCDRAEVAVTESPRLLRRSHRTLVLGAPVVVTVDVAMLTAVLAHELGHYSRRHTALDRLTHRGLEMLLRLLWRLGPRSLLGRVVVAWTSAYAAIAAATSRRFELEADRFAAELVGPEAAARAVEEVPVVAAGWQRFRRGDLLTATEAGLRPAGVFQHFGQLWARGERRAQAVVDAGRWDETTLFDTHPPTEQRAARLRALDETAHTRVGEDEAPALALLRDPEGTLARVEDEMYAGRPLTPVDWDELVRREGRERARGAAEQLGWAAEQEGLAERGDLAALLEIVEDGHGTRLSGRYMDRGAPELSRRLHLIDLLTRTVENALVEQHGHRHEPGPDGGPVLVGDDGLALPLRDMVARAVADPAQVERLRRWAGERELLRVHRTLDVPRR